MEGTSEEDELTRTRRLIRRLEDLESRSDEQERQLTLYLQERARLTGGKNDCTSLSLIL